MEDNKGFDYNLKREIQKIMKTYDNSSIFARWVGSLIDFIILIMMFYIIEFIEFQEGIENTLILCLVISFFTIYYPIMESLGGGTIGKKVVGYRVVNKKLNNPSFLQSYIRSITRLIEVNPILLGGIPAGIVCLFSLHKQRIGDALAGTYVIENKDYRKLKKQIQLQEI